MKRPTGFTSTTVKHLLLDAGAYYRNFDISKPASEQKDKLIGATAGGGSFTAVLTIRQVDVDGKRGAVKGFDEAEGWEVSMTSNVKEITAENLKQSLAAADITDVASGTLAGYQKISGRNEIQGSDYAENITWLGWESGSLKPLIIVVYNALATNGLSVTTQDKNEAVVPMTLRGSYDPDDLDKPPFDIYYPPIN